MRLKNILGLTAGAVVAAGLFTATPASAASLPCNLTSSANSGSVTCYSGSPYTWRLVVDCLDTSDPRLPVLKETLYGAWHTGDGTETLACAAGQHANARVEAS